MPAPRPLDVPGRRRRLSRFSELRLRTTESAPSWIVHYGRFGSWETLLDVCPGGLCVRKRAEGRSSRWKRRRLGLKRPHRIVVLPDGRAIIADTDNDRLVLLEHIATGGMRCRRVIGGHRLRRPHDVLWSAADGHCYVVDATSICRFRSTARGGECWKFPARQLGYARALACLDGRVHVICSSRGAVLRLDDFRARRFRAYLSPGKRGQNPAGSWASTGLILNDVVQVGGWYYGSNYFCREYAGETDPNLFRLIRWRTWSDFERGRWEDLSAGIPRDLVPYFFTVTRESVFLVAFCHDDHSRDNVFRLEPADFERMEREP